MAAGDDLHATTQGRKSVPSNLRGREGARALRRSGGAPGPVRARARASRRQQPPQPPRGSDRARNGALRARRGEPGPDFLLLTRAR